MGAGDGSTLRAAGGGGVFGGGAYAITHAGVFGAAAAMIWAYAAAPAVSCGGHSAASEDSAPAEGVDAKANGSGDGDGGERHGVRRASQRNRASYGDGEEKAAAGRQRHHGHGADAAHDATRGRTMTSWPLSWRTWSAQFAPIVATRSHQVGRSALRMSFPTSVPLQAHRALTGVMRPPASAGRRER